MKLIKRKISLYFVVKRIFSPSTLLINFFDLLRIPFKNTFNTFFTNFIENKLDDILNDEENIINVIHALRGKYFFEMKINNLILNYFLDTIFPNDAKDQQ
jgi:DNA topoisomerase IA